MMISFSMAKPRTGTGTKAVHLGTILLRAAPPDLKCSWRRFLNGTLSERDKLTPTELGLIRFPQPFISTSQIIAIISSPRTRYLARNHLSRALNMTLMFYIAITLETERLRNLFHNWKSYEIYRIKEDKIQHEVVNDSAMFEGITVARGFKRDLNCSENPPIPSHVKVCHQLWSLSKVTLHFYLVRTATSEVTIRPD
jgi:hypothetical protein